MKYKIFENKIVPLNEIDIYLNGSENNIDKSAKDILLEYVDDPDIYISFTSINKIGINPKTGFNTPNGIYTYPLIAFKNELMSNPEHLTHVFPFAADGKYIQVLKSKNLRGFVKDIYKYSSKNFDDDMDKIKRLLLDNTGIEDPDEYMQSLVKKAQRKARVKSPFGMFWYITKKIKKDYGTRFGHHSDSQSWNNILRKLGYDGFCDRKGQAIIHESEPVQAVFLHRRAFEHVGTILNVCFSDDIPEWLEKAEKEDYSFDIINGRVVWRYGTWKLGRWSIGTWKSGTFEYGEWNSGTFEGGVFEDGVWLGGEFKGGTFEGGLFEGGLWTGGTFEGGSFRGGNFMGGTFNGGTFNGGKWERGTWKDGKWIKGKILDPESAPGIHHYVESDVNPNEYFKRKRNEI